MTMHSRMLIGAALVVSAASCSRDGRRTKDSTQASAPGTVASDSAPRLAADSVKADSARAMAGMDHSKMGDLPGMNHSAPAAVSGSAPSTSGNAMAGMDHSKMPGMGTKAATPTSGPTAGMDHSKMPGMAPKTSTEKSGTMAGMDHSKMPGTAVKTSTEKKGTTAGMDHSKMVMAPDSQAKRNASSAQPAMDHAAMGHATPSTTDPAAAVAADEKLVQIAARLVQDSIVMRRIQMDSTLRNRWADSAVRRLILNPQ